MFKSLTKQNGNAIVGILVVLAIIAALYYGGSFFWDKDAGDTAKKNAPSEEQTEEASGFIKKLNIAKEKIANINKKTEEVNQEIEKIESESQVINNEEYNTEEWQSYEDEDRGFRIKFHKNWYFTINHQEARAKGYDLIIGFASTSSIWEQKPPYPIEMQIIPNTTNYQIPDNTYNKILAETDERKYIILTQREDYREILDLMAESFTLDNRQQTIDDSGEMQVYKNEEYGFEFRYPESLLTENNKNINTDNIQEFRDPENDCTQNKNYCGIPTPTFSVSYNKWDNQINIEDYIKGKDDLPHDIKEQQIGNNNFINYISGEMYTKDNYLMIGDNKIIEFTFYMRENLNKELKNKILDTFEFINN